MTEWMADHEQRAAALGIALGELERRLGALEAGRVAVADWRDSRATVRCDGAAADGAAGGGDVGVAERACLAACVAAGLRHFRLYVAPPDYYARSLEQRRVLLGARSAAELCKTLVVENTRWEASAGEGAPRFFAFVLQYVRRFSKPKAERAVHAAYASRGLSAAKAVNLTMAAAEDSERVTGYSYGSVTIVGWKTPLPILLDRNAHALPEIILGGGHMDLKLRLDCAEFAAALPECTVADVTEDDGSSDEDEER